MLSVPKRWHTAELKAIDGFTIWFTSSAGVAETAMVTAAVVVLEFSFPTVDPHLFWLLVWLTVYSAITQPALAYAGRMSSEHLMKLETQMGEHVKLLETRHEELVRHYDDLVRLLKERQG
jgi:hypothetical protein